MIKMGDKEYMDNSYGKTSSEVACLKVNKGMGINITMHLEKYV